MDYKDIKAVNKSTLWELRKSPAHYFWAVTHETPDTPAMKFGRAIHKAILEPRSFYDEYAIVPKVDRRTKEGKEEWSRFLSENEGRELITTEDRDLIKAMYAMFKESGGCEYIKGEHEKVVTWTDPETGVPCKGRLDVLGDGFVADYKTASDASTRAFTREALRYGYDLQAAMYLTATGLKTFYFLVQEKTEPYAINIIKAGDAFIERGLWIMRDLLTLYKECSETNCWPGYNGLSGETNELVIADYEVMSDS